MAMAMLATITVMMPLARTVIALAMLILSPLLWAPLLVSFYVFRQPITPLLYYVINHQTSGYTI